MVANSARPASSNWRAAGHATRTYVLVAFGIAAGSVVLRGGSGSGDLVAFAFWTALSTPGFFLLSLLLRRWTASRAVAFGIAGAILLGITYAIAWTKVVTVVLGPWVMAFSFPVGFSWLTAAGAGFLVSWGRGRSPGGRRAAAVSWLVATAAVVLASQLLSARPSRPDVVVTITDDASESHVAAVWKLADTPPTPTRDTYNPEGIRTVSRQDRGEVRRLRITFHPGGDKNAQAALLNRLRGSPYVKSVQEVQGEEDPLEH